MGYARREGYDMEARLLRASVDYNPAEVCLVPEPRGAFSNLRPYSLPDVKLGPEQIQLQPLVRLLQQLMGLSSLFSRVYSSDLLKLCLSCDMQTAATKARKPHRLCQQCLHHALKLNYHAGCSCFPTALSCGSYSYTGASQC